MGGTQGGVAWAGAEASDVSGCCGRVDLADVLGDVGEVESTVDVDGRGNGAAAGACGESMWVEHCRLRSLLDCLDYFLAGDEAPCDGREDH